MTHQQAPASTVCPFYVELGIGECVTGLVRYGKEPCKALDNNSAFLCEPVCCCSDKSINRKSAGDRMELHVVNNL